MRWLIFALCSALLFIYGLAIDSTELRLLTKGLPVLALIFWLRSAPEGPYRRWISLGLLFSLAGDIILDWPADLFVFGLGAFLIGHLCYLVAYLSDSRRFAPLALLLALAAGGLSLVRLRREARVTPSPNGGWPMGAMALALGVRLGKPGVYTLNATGQPPGPHDTDRACALAGRALGLIRFSLLILLLTQFLLPSPWPTDGGQHG